MIYKFKDKDDYIEAYMFMLRIGEGFNYHVDNQTIEAHAIDEEIINRFKQHNGVELDEYNAEMARPIHQSL